MKPFWRNLLGDCLIVILACAAGAAILFLISSVAMGGPMLVLDGAQICQAGLVEYQTGAGVLLVECSPVIFSDGFE
jgi:hypothetical protein